MTNTTVTPRTAQALPAIYSAVAVISEAVASLPVRVYQNGKESDAHPVAGLLAKPNHWQSSFEFIEYLTRSALLTGNGYAWIHDSELEPLHPEQVSIEQLSKPVDGLRFRYLVTDRFGGLHTLMPYEVLHLRAPSDDGITGQSPIAMCRQAIGLGLDQQAHGAATFKNGARPSGVLEFDKFLNDDKAERIKAGWNDQYQGADNSGKTAILEGGVKFRPIAVTNADAEWLASREFTVKEIARMYRMPAYFLGDLSGNTYANTNEARRAFLTQCLLPWLRRWTGAIGRDLLEDGATVEFDTREYLRGDTTERYAAYQVGLAAGFLTVEEVRESENLPPLVSPEEPQTGHTLPEGAEASKSGGSDDFVRVGEYQ